MPGAEHVDRHDLLRAARRVVRQRPEMHNRSAACCRMPDLGQIQKIHVISAVKADHVMAEATQMASNRNTNIAAMAGDQMRMPP